MYESLTDAITKLSEARANSKELVDQCMSVIGELGLLLMRLRDAKEEQTKAVQAVQKYIDDMTRPGGEYELSQAGAQIVYHLEQIFPHIAKIIQIQESEKNGR